MTDDHDEDHAFLHGQAEAAAFTYLYIKFDGEMECVADALSNLLAGYLSDPNTDREHADWIMQNLHMSCTLIGNPVGNA